MGLYFASRYQGLRNDKNRLVLLGKGGKLMVVSLVLAFLGAEMC